MRARCGAALLGALALWGCRAPELLSPEVRTPVTVQGVSAEFPADGRGRFALSLSVAPVGRPVALSGVDWEIWIGERWFAAGVKPLSREVARDETAQLVMDLPVAFDQRVAPGPVQLPLRVRGRLHAQLGSEERRWPFEGRFTVTADGAPRLEPGGRE